MMLSKCFAVIILLSHRVTVTFTQTLVITDDPMDTTVCTGSIANISCGFVNLSNMIVPNWRIIRRSNDGSVISNMTISGTDINNNDNDGLEYIPDITSGPLMAPNSRLVVGPVDETDNQSSYQCSFALAGGNVESNVGTLTVTGIPSVENLTAVDNCTSITVSWDITDEGSCKDLSYNVSLISRDGRVTLQSIITNATSHTFTGVETSNEMFNVSVTAFNEIATGPSHTATADVRVSSNDLPLPVDLRTVSRICVTYFNISWNASNRITCGDVSYEMSVFQSSIEQSMEEITRVGDVFYFSVTGLNNSDPDVMVTVTASNRAGQGNMSITVRLPPSLDPPPINDVTVSTSRTPSDLSGFDIFIMWTRPVIDDPCTTLPVSVYTINTSVTFMNGSQTNYVSNNIMDTSGDSMGRFNVSYNDSFDEELVPNATYVFAINSELPSSPPPTPCTCVSESDELSTGVAVAISIVVTFIITLVVTALISIIITSLYYKHLFKKLLVRQEGDSHALTEDIKSNDPAYATTRANITMDTNPAYGTATTIKMDTNPAYATTTT